MPYSASRRALASSSSSNTVLYWAVHGAIMSSQVRIQLANLVLQPCRLACPVTLTLFT